MDAGGPRLRVKPEAREVIFVHSWDVHPSSADYARKGAKDSKALDDYLCVLLRLCATIDVRSGPEPEPRRMVPLGSGSSPEHGVGGGALFGSALPQIQKSPPGEGPTG